MKYLKDVFLTESFFIKGHVSTGARRLSTYLNGLDRPFLEVHNPTIIRCTDGTLSQSDRALMRLDEILIAVELDDAEGDETLKSLAERGRNLTPVKIHVGGAIPLEIEGEMDSHTSERADLGPNDFIVIREPTFRGLPSPATPEQSFPEATPYVIVNRNRIKLIFL